MSKLHDICKEYDFCTPETRAELEANGFDFSVCKFGITEFIGARMQTDYDVETKGLIPYPTFTEVWRLLPIVLANKRSNINYYKQLNEYGVSYECLGSMYIRNAGTYMPCEAACQMWLKLKKGGFLND